MFGKSKFDPHGEFNIQIRDGIFLIKVMGAWNLEGKQMLISELWTSIKKIAPKKFSMLVDVSEFELGTPDFQSIGLTEKSKLIEIGLLKTAYVNKGNRTSHLQQIESMQPSSTEYQWNIFSSSHAALMWLDGKSLNSRINLA